MLHVTLLANAMGGETIGMQERLSLEILIVMSRCGEAN